jgi:hypothetical protein
MSLYDKTMYDSTLNTISGPAPSPTYTVTSVDNTVSNGAGLYWGMNGTSGGSGQVLTSNGTSTGWITQVDPSLKGATLSVKGNADFEGEVTIKGKNLTEMLEKIDERLAILHPNPKLEDRWDELKELSKRYKELEAELIEKEKVWAILKK